MSRRLRVTGTLSKASRGWLLTTPDQSVWVLETDYEMSEPAGSTVVVEGETHGLDRLRVDWIGALIDSDGPKASRDD